MRSEPAVNPSRPTTLRPTTLRLGAMRAGAASVERRDAGVSPRALAARGLPATDHLRVDPVVVAVALISNLLGLAVPMATLQVYDRIIPTEGIATLSLLAIGLVGVAVAEFLLRATQGALLGFSALRFSQRIQVNAIGAVFERRSADLGDFTATNERFNAIDKLGDYLGGPNRVGLIDLPFSFIFLGAIAAVGGVLVAAPIAVFLVFLVVARGIATSARRVAEEREEQDARTADFFAEAFSRTHTLKTLAIEPLIMRRYERLTKRTTEIHLRAVHVANEMERAPLVFGALSSIATLTLGAVLVIDGALTVGGLAACSLLAGRAIQPLLRLAKGSQETQKAAVAADQVAKLFHRPPCPIADQITAPDAPPRVVARGRTLSIGGKTLLRDVSFEIEPGELAFVYGADGSGRSALLREMAGLGEESGGGGLRVAGLSPADYRVAQGGRVVLATSADVLFSGTILQNLTIFGRGARVDDARWAAALTGLEQRVRALPEGFDTHVAHGAVETLSAGMMQLILLTRAVAQRPKLLLLDDPFAYLDVDAASQVLEAVKALRDRMTIIATPNQLELGAHADQILMIENKRIESRSPFSAPRAGRAAVPRIEAAGASSTNADAAKEPFAAAAGPAQTAEPSAQAKRPERRSAASRPIAEPTIALPRARLSEQLAAGFSSSCVLARSGEALAPGGVDDAIEALRRDGLIDDREPTV